LYSKGFSELTSLPQDVAYSISSAVTQLSIGELLDVELSSTFNEDLDAYFDMIYKKTASLIEASAFSAALLAKKDAKRYGIYGKNLGLAFQIIDDILDITQSQEVLGKPALNDFKEGKTTLPYLYMYNDLNDKEKEQLRSYFKKELSEEESMWIKKKMAQTNAINRSIEYAKKLGFEALEMIKEENSPELEKIIKEMIVREF
jgi:octaprenyl-diphosphate synthase